ncbi:hypothetical protein HOD38_02205, partial [archaeon]|nr:hypothetical protein [archaeon]
DLKTMLVDYAEKTKKPKALEAEFTLEANDMQHRLTDAVKREVGGLDTKLTKQKFEEWLRERLKQL